MKIKFSTENEAAFELFKPEPVKKHLPEWYKDTPRTDSDPKRVRSYGPNQSPFTVTSCIPVQDYMMSGYVLLNTSERMIETIPNTDPVDFSDYAPDGRMGYHRHAQCPVHIGGRKNHYFKLWNPWTISTPKGYSCLFYQPEYLMETRYRLMPAIVDTDTYVGAVNFPGVLLTDEPFMLKAGAPLMVVFPFKRDEWDSEVSFEKQIKNNKLSVYLHGMYKKVFHQKKVYR